MIDNNIIASKGPLAGPDAINISWYGKNVENIKATQIVFWNSGNKYIDSDIMKGPLFILPNSPCNILGISILKKSRNIICFA